MTTQTKTTWRKVKLGDVALEARDLYQPSKEEHLPYIGLEHIQPQTLRFTEIGDSRQVQSTKKRFKAGDVLFGSLRAYFRKVIRPDFDGVCSTDITVLRPRNDELNRKYLFYLVADKRFIDRAAGSGEGTRMPRAGWKVISKFDFNIPSEIIDQKRIADILSAFDDKIELNNKISRTLEQMAQAIFKEWFIENSKFKNQNAKLEEIAKIIKGKKPQKVYAKSQGEDIEYLLIESFITNNQFFTDDKKVPQSGDWDTIIVMDGASSGRIFRGRVGAVGSTLAVIKPKPEVSREFLFLLLKQAELQLMGNLTGSAIPHLDKDFLKTYPVSIPASGEMEKFTIVVRPMLQKMVETENENQKLAALRDLLLPKLMSGDIRV